MTNHASGAVGVFSSDAGGILFLAIACVLTFAVIYNLEGFCKMMAAMATNREITKLRRERMALLFERRMERNKARAARELEVSDRGETGSTTPNVQFRTLEV
jgi:hypothetical protein